MVAILAPYGRNEVTAAAIRLADLAGALGHEVKFVACGVHERRVHPAWDGRVRSARGTGITRAAAGASTVVHFQAHQAWHAGAALPQTGKRPIRHVLVPDWHGLVGRRLDLVARYDQVVCPTKACAQVVTAAAFRGVKQDKGQLAWVRWDSGLSQVRREGTVAPDRIKAAVYCDAATVDFCGAMVLRMVDELLPEYPRLDLTLLSVKSWGRRERAEIRRLCGSWGGRLTAARVTTAVDADRAFHANDWVVLPGVRGDFGLTASRALACGAAVICNDVAPFSEQVTSDCGILVACEIRSNAITAPVAVPHLGRWADACRRAFSDSRTLLNLRTRDWGLEDRHVTFNTTWQKILAG